jgi:hypothetical protein
MNPVNRIVFSRREYPNKDDLYAAVAQQIRFLLESGYIIVANKEDEVGDGIAIDYSFARTNDDWPRPFWLVKNEMIAAADEHINNEVDNAKTILSTSEKANDFVNTFMTNLNGGNKGGNNGGGHFDA